MQTKPVKAIREYCLECCLNNANEVRECTASGCPLYAFRMGKNPYRTKRELTDEEKAKLAERLNSARLASNVQPHRATEE